MLIDLILDRKDGQEYDSRDFYNQVNEYGETFGDSCWDVARAMDGGENSDVQRELCRYIMQNGYNMNICDYVNSVEWI